MNPGLTQAPELGSTSPGRSSIIGAKSPQPIMLSRYQNTVGPIPDTRGKFSSTGLELRPTRICVNGVADAGP
jgi:hypothetical protein